MMVKQLTKNLLTICALIFGFQMVIAQNVFWSEDFSSTMDLPTGWTSEDASGGDGVWIWCSSPTQASTCIPNWDLYADQHDGNYYAATADNGFVMMDSDILGTVAPDHIVRLTTDAIDCSGQSEVWVKFESLIGVYGLAATDNAILRASTNGTDWTDFNVFQLSLATRWSENPEICIVDISSVAAGSSTVYIQWSWTGNYEYYWLIDDLQFYDSDPTPIYVLAHDMRVNENFYAIAPNAQWPASQVECFSFLADIENVGSMPQTNVNLNISINEVGGSNVFSDDLFYGEIVVDSLAENQPFENCFTPANVVGTSYDGTYLVTADSVDLAPENNSQVFNFEITDTVFAKEFGATQSIQPAGSNWDDGEAHSWAYGNHFYIVDGSPNWYASSATFGIDDPGPELVGRLLTAYLYKWDEDTNEDGNMDPDERTQIGFNIYEISGTETQDGLITLPLLQFPSGEAGPIELESNQAYVLMVEYSTIDDVDFAMAGAAVDYGAMAYRSELDGGIPAGLARYGYMLGINGDLSTEPYSSAGFVTAVTPVVRLNLAPAPSKVEETLDEANLIEIAPNPADQKINLKVDLVEKHANVNIRILDIHGRLMTNQEFDDIQNEMIEFDLNNFASGAYFLHFITEKGVRTERFIVQH